MHKVLLFALLSLSSAFVRGQLAPTLHKVRSGDVIKEVIVFKDMNNKDNFSELPAKNHTLLYRFRDSSGHYDNADSIAELENILSQIEAELKQLPDFKYLHVACISHIKDATEIYRLQKKTDSTRAAAYKANPVSHGWEFLYVDLTRQKISSVLHAGKLCLIGPKGKVMATGFVGNFSQRLKIMQSGKTIRGKLLTEQGGTTSALERTHVSLIKAGQDKVAETYTDKYGDFELDLPDASISYTLTAKPESPDVNNVILATEQGVHISRFRKTKDGFQFPLMKAEVQRLSETPEQDVTLVFNKFKGSKDANLKISENILYPSGQYQIDPRSHPALDKVADILKNNPNVKLEIISHTDARGEDAANLKLSEKRSQSVLEYLASKGIDKARLKAIGKGESMIRNRCKNNVDCSDKEHEFNRRTEFRFSRP